MRLSDDQIIAQNAWWAGSWRQADPHLRRLSRQPMRLPAEVVAELDLHAPAIHVLRGPRQVGKSTDLKLLVERALDEGRDPRVVIYIALDLLEGQPHAEMANSVLRAKELSNRPGPHLLLLDEVTFVERWQTAVKSLYDDGHIEDDVVICTGSSAIDLHQGAAERLPGRRQQGQDHLVLPQSFAGFAQAFDSNVPRSPRLTVAQLHSPDGQDALREVAIHAPALRRALDLYLVFGGLPAAVAEAASGASEPSDATKRVLYDSLFKELQRKGTSMPATHALLERVARSLGSKTNWSDMARDMNVPLGTGRGTPSYHTLRAYIEFMAAAYFLFIVYFWRARSDANSQSNDKKVFFGDPLLYTLTRDRAPGLPFDQAALVENCVGLALLRRYEPESRLIESFLAPDQLHIWQTAKGKEIDFVCGPRSATDVVEVKYQNNPGTSAASAAARAHPGRPVIMATKDALSLGPTYSLIPTHTLLWAIG